MLEKLCLQWNDFKENVVDAFGSLREDNNFADVTLACEDGKKVEAQKVILAASSPTFRTLLEGNKHPHPLIYMRGMKSNNLLAILDFLYRGEANVLQDDLDSFLALAEELQLKGLMGNSEGKFEDSNKDERYLPAGPEQSLSNTNNETVSQRIPPKLQNQTKFQPTRILSLPVDSGFANPENLSVDLTELDEKVKSLMEKSQNRDSRGQFAFVCKICGKEGQGRNIKDHIEANHLKGVLIPCNFCEKTFRTRQALGQHKGKTHP